MDTKTEQQQGSPFALGVRWEDRDWRERGPNGEPRVVKVVNPPSAYGTNDYVRVRVVEAPNKPHTVGRESTLRSITLLRRYSPQQPQPKKSEEKQEYRVLAERRSEHCSTHHRTLKSAKERADELVTSGVTQLDPWNSVRIQLRADADSPWEDVDDE